MKARRNIIVLFVVLLAGSIAWYLWSTHQAGGLRLVGTVDANEVILSSQIPGRIATLPVQEGQHIRSGELVATIQSDDLKAAMAAAAATTRSDAFKVQVARDTQTQLTGQTSSLVTSAAAQLRAAQASLAQALAQYEHQQANTQRTVALAKAGVASAQSRDEAVTASAALRSAVNVAKENVAAAEASLKVAMANTNQARAAAQTTASAHAAMQSADALQQQAEIELGYADIRSPVTGTLNVLAARQGEVVAAGTPIATVMDLSQTWVYAPLPETYADAVQLGDTLKVEVPSGATTTGTVIAKAALADFATQRDVNRTKRDIKTVQLKLLISNPGERFVPGMTAYVYIPRSRLGKP
jgi:multidrug resistance efflux pump